MKCPKCRSDKKCKNGKRKGNQCYKCLECSYQYTLDLGEVSRRETTKGMAVALYIVGLSMRTIAKLFGVNASTILEWVRNFAIENYQKPTPKGPVVIELDEMWHFLHSKKTDSGYGKLIVALQASSLIGNVAIVVPPLSEGC